MWGPAWEGQALSTTWRRAVHLLRPELPPPTHLCAPSAPFHCSAISGGWGQGGIWVAGQSWRLKGARGGVTPGKLPCSPLVTTLAWLNARDSGPSCPSDRRMLPAFLSPGGRGPLALNHSWKRCIIRALLPGPQAELEKQAVTANAFL